MCIRDSWIIVLKCATWMASYLDNRRVRCYPSTTTWDKRGGGRVPSPCTIPWIETRQQQAVLPRVSSQGIPEVLSSYNCSSWFPPHQPVSHPLSGFGDPPMAQDHAPPCRRTSQEASYPLNSSSAATYAARGETVCLEFLVLVQPHATPCARNELIHRKLR